MKFIASLTTTIFITAPAMAHTGHMARVDGHTHTIVEVLAMGALPAIAGLAVLGLAVWATRRTNS